MQLMFFRSLWGMTGTLAHNLGRIAAAGYDGVELNPLDETVSARELRHMLDMHGLNLVCIGQCPEPADVEALCARSADLGAVRTVVHSGRDSMSFDEGCRFFEAALRTAGAHRTIVAHETHRARLLFTPWITAAYLRQFPELRICADFSHWVNVCERLLDDRADDLALAISRTAHTHTRVGHAEGPQVNDPRAPEWAPELAAHLGWWRRIAQEHVSRDEKVWTATCEFGPPNYMPTVPHTRQPLADLAEVCLWIREEVRASLAPIAL